MTVKRSDRDIVLRAFTFFQDAANGVGLQMERIQGDPTNDAKTISHLWFDWQTLMTHLWRMRKAALLLGKASSVNSKVQKSITAFDKALPGLKTYRDVFEHMEAYVFEDDKRHNVHIGNGGLQVGAVSNDTFSWAIDDTEFSLQEAATASSRLYQEIKMIKNGAVRTMIHPNVFTLQLPEYTADRIDNLGGIGLKMDALLFRHFEDKSVILRCIDISDHPKSRNEVIDLIIGSGTDHYIKDQQNRGYDSKEIDMCAYEINEPVKQHSAYFCNPAPFNPTNTVKANILVDFYNYEKLIDSTRGKRIDLVLVYDATKLKNKSYSDPRDKAGLRKDGFIFKNPENKAEALLGILNFTI